MLNNSVLISGTEKVRTVLTTNRMQHVTVRKYNVVRSYVGLLVKLAAIRIWGQIQLKYFDTQTTVC